MWKYVKFVIGILLIFMSIVGVFSLFSGDLEEAGLRIAENGVDTVGVVDEVIVTTWAARKGWVGGFGRYYTMNYTFKTLDGRKFSSEVQITKEQAYSISDGQEIRVRYYANQPSINSPLGFKTYMSAKDAKDVPYGTMIFAQVLFFLGGLWLTWSNWRRIRPASNPQTAASRMAAGYSQPAAAGGSADTDGRSGGFGRR